MIFYLSATRDRWTLEAVRARVDRLGMLCLRGSIYRAPEFRGPMDFYWGYDNGAFADATKGRPFDEVQFKKDVARMFLMEWWPRMCVLPDVPFQGPVSLAVSESWAGVLPRSLPWFLAVQDGMDPEEVERVLVERGLYGLFVGGTDAFKATLPQWVQLAHKHGARCHLGRASTLERIRWANEVGADSADSSFFQWKRDRMHALLDFVDRDFTGPQLRLVQQ